MQEPVCLEQYPIAVVIGSNLLSLLIYVIGAYILYNFGVIWVIGYVIYICFLEFRLLSGHCIDCYYHGKTCAFGKGRISALLFKKGMTERFNRKKITWKEMIPDILVFFFPFIAGIMFLIHDFSWVVLILIITLLLLALPGNAMVRGKLACTYCKQREIGCPADQLFNKTT